jgi:hypothetical protein
MRINLVWMNLSLIAYRGSRCALLHYKHNQFPARLMLKSASASEMHSLASDPVRLHILGRFELAPIAGADYLIVCLGDAVRVCPQTPQIA